MLDVLNVAFVKA